MRKLSATLAGVVFVGWLLTGINSASAQQQSSIVVSPVTFELTANPGDVLTNQIKVTSQSSSTIQLEIKVENIVSTGEQGQVRLTEESTTYAVSSWVETNPKQFTIAPNETKTVDFTIRVPKDAEPGGHYGSILAGTIATDSITGSGTSISQRVGSLVLVRVSGEAKESLQLTRFRSKTFVGAWDEVTASDGKSKILVAKDENFDREKMLSYYKSGPVAFDLVFHNSGTVHVKPTGSVVIYDLFGRKVGEQIINARNVFPGSDRRITVVWPKNKLWGVYYRAHLAGSFGSPSQTITARTTFWAFPLPAAIAIAAILVFIVLARRRLAKVIRVLIKGH